MAKFTWKAYREARRAEAIGRLRKGGLVASDTVYVILRHVGVAGTTRYYDLYVIHDGKPGRITQDVGIVLNKNYSRDKGAIRVNRCDSEAGRVLVGDLAWRVFHNTAALKYCCLEP